MARRISTTKKMSHAKFVKTFASTVTMNDGPAKDKFLLEEWKRNMKEIQNSEELIAKQRLEVEEQISGLEKQLGDDEEQE